MSLYDDVDTNQNPDWRSGINKLLPQPKQIKIQQQPKKFHLIAPVSSLKPKIATVDEHKPREIIKPRIIHHQPILPAVDFSKSEKYDDFYYTDEYNPSIPNEYEKIVKERREKVKVEDRKRHRSPSPKKVSGFGRRRASSDEEEDNFRPTMSSNRVGTAIAPPKSLQESSPIVDHHHHPASNSNFGSVAVKIMQKYGFKEGQGLGKKEQGISTALQVEKTSKRGGRIINEKEIAAAAAVVVAPVVQNDASSYEDLPSITEMMKNPSKVILLRNMVGPGEVDDDLMPEVKDECTTKYGEVNTVHITEMQDKIPEETVRIFVEFKKVEHAIKALVDLNGRFFGGRQVRCCFYESNLYENFVFDA